jgi:predicted amidophosphoribosyltransferase
LETGRSDNNWLQLLKKNGLVILRPLNYLIEIAAPGQCIGCGRFVSGEIICGSCHKEVEYSDDTWCEHCALPAESDHMAGCRFSSNHIREQSLPWFEARTLGAYSGLLRQACLSGKKAHGIWACQQLVSYWLKRHKSWVLNQGPIWVVPIPRHWSRSLIHSHDPAVEIAGSLVRQTRSREVRMGHFLKRQKATPHLAELDSQHRFELMSEVFASQRSAAESLAKISSVLLVDDILTTGATAMAAANAMKKAGARKIYLAAMTRTLERVD